MTKYTVSDLQQILNEGRVKYHQVDVVDWDAYRAAEATKLQQFGVSSSWQLPVEERVHLTDFKREFPIVTVVDSEEESVSYSELFSMLECSAEFGVVLEGLGTAYLIEEYGGEGQGEEYWYVFKLTTPLGVERFFKVDGYYQSYDGGYFDEMYEVFPKQVQVTRWEQKS